MEEALGIKVIFKAGLKGAAMESKGKKKHAFQEQCDPFRNVWK